ncbi:MAG: nucleotidyltransferase domain-containing protein [Treponema sp.]|nr:nucleotidyltransferase domain-containing protein [Treponema sp.]
MVAISGISSDLSLELTNLVDLIASDKSVVSVVLFGSTATGKRTEDSDIDLMVLVEAPSVDALEFSASIRKRSFDLISFPMDLIVETARDYQERSVLPTLERKIAREGKVLYAS